MRIDILLPAGRRGSRRHQHPPEHCQEHGARGHHVPGVAVRSLQAGLRCLDSVHALPSDAWVGDAQTFERRNPMRGNRMRQCLLATPTAFVVAAWRRLHKHVLRRCTPAEEATRGHDPAGAREAPVDDGGRPRNPRAPGAALHVPPARCLSAIQGTCARVQNLDWLSQVRLPSVMLPPARAFADFVGSLISHCFEVTCVWNASSVSSVDTPSSIAQTWR